MLQFSPEQIPDVRRPNLKLDSGGSLLRESTHVPTDLPGGKSDLKPRRARDHHEAPASVPQSHRGNLGSIEPLRDCPSLKKLWLENLTRLTSLSPLAELPDLRELMVTYCSRLNLDRSMLRMPAIRKTQFLRQ